MKKKAELVSGIYILSISFLGFLFCLAFACVSISYADIISGSPTDVFQWNDPIFNMAKDACIDDIEYKREHAWELLTEALERYIAVCTQSTQATNVLCKDDNYGAECFAAVKKHLLKCPVSVDSDEDKESIRIKLMARIGR